MEGVQKCTALKACASLAASERSGAPRVQGGASEELSSLWQGGLQKSGSKDGQGQSWCARRSCRKDQLLLRGMTTLF